MAPHQENISLSPGELIYQETKRISWSPSGFQKSMVPHQEKISWSPGELIHQETKIFSRSPSGLIHQETRLSPGGVPPFFLNPLGDQEILLVSWWINLPGDKEIFSWWGAILF